MARQPFFSGNYGSALGQIDTRPIMQGAAAQAAMYQGLGQNIGGAIEKYQLNKVKRAKMTGEIEAYIKENPDYINESTMTGDEAADKKNMTQFEKFAAGDLNMAGLEGLAGKLARGDTLRKNRLLEESQRTSNEAGRFNLDLAKKLEESKISVAKSEGALAALKAIGFTKEQKTVLENLEARTLSVIADTSKTIAETAEMPKAAKALDKLAKPDAAGWKEAEVQVAAAKLKNVDLVFARNSKGKGLVITSMKGDIESLGQKIPGFPDHLLYGGSVWDLSGKKPIKVGVEDVMAIQKMNIAAVNALMDEVTTAYMKHKQMGELDDDGNYVLDLGDGVESKVQQDPEMDQKVFQILRLQEGIADPLDIR